MANSWRIERLANMGVCQLSDPLTACPFERNRERDLNHPKRNGKRLKLACE